MNRKPRVLHVMGSSAFGGGTRYVVSLSEMIMERGGQVDVVTSDLKTISMLTEKRIGVVEIASFRREIHPYYDSLAMIYLYSHIRRNRYDIVHTHTSKGGVIGRAAAKAARVKGIVHTVHGFSFHEQSKPFEIKLYASIEKLFSHLADKIIVVNHFDRLWGLKLGIFSEEKAVTIHNGIEPIVFAKSPQAVRDELGIDKGIRTIGFVSRLAEQKGLERLIDAFSLLVEKIPNVWLIIVGDGPLRKRIESLSESKRVAHKVVFTGFRDDAREFYQIFDVFVLPSLWEGFSITLLEAMSAGCPIVATKIKGNDEMIEHGVCGLLVPPGDGPSLAESLQRLLENRELASELAGRAKARFQERFTEEIMKKNTWEIYKTLI